MLSSCCARSDPFPTSISATNVALESPTQTDVDERFQWTESLELARIVANRIPQEPGRTFLQVMGGLTAHQIEAICWSIFDGLSKVLSEEFKKLHMVMEKQEASSSSGTAPDGSVAPAKFEVSEMCCGGVADFFLGVDDRIGHPSLQFEAGMKAEHCSKKGCDVAFVNPTSKKSTTASREWAITVDFQPLTSEEEKGKRIIKTIEELEKTKTGKSLHRCEVIAVALYTGPMFTVYNTVVRRKPKDVYEIFKDNLFPTTICVLISAVHKLSRKICLAEGLKVYRGLGGGLKLPAKFIEADEQGCRGITEWGFTSTTSDWRTAVEYSGLRDGKLQAVVLEAEVGAIARGAYIGELSQYPHQEEYLLPPCSFVEPNGRQRLVVEERDILTVVPVKLFPNVKTLTIEGLQEQKKRIHVTAFYHMLGQIRQDLEAAAQNRTVFVGMDAAQVQSFIQNIIYSCKFYYQRHLNLAAIEFTDDDMFRALVVEMLHVKAMASASFFLGLTDESALAKYVERSQMKTIYCGGMPLNEAYSTMIKIWHDKLPDDQNERRLAAAELCLQEGLMVKELSEPGIVKAARQGNSVRTLELLLSAGAKLSDTDWRANTALHQSSRHGHLELLKSLLTLKADHAARGQVADSWFGKCVWG